MPKHTGKGRSRKGFVALRVDKQITLSTLADATFLVADLFGGALTEDLYVISADVTWAIRGQTANEGPIEVGYAHGDYTVTELAQWSVSDQFSPDDKIAQEQGRRLVRSAGMFPALNISEVLNNGTPLKTKIRFTVGSGIAFNIWALNSSGGALTGGAVVEIHGTIYGRWLR